MRAVLRNVAVLGMLFAALAAGASAGAEGKSDDGTVLGENGLYTQSWFLQSFLDLREDLQEAAAAGKRLVIIWEQKGCPYCREMHLVNFAKPEIRDYIRKHFVVVQLDLWGARKVTDFDGKELSEKALAQRYGIRFTPTIMFMPVSAKAGKSGKDIEVARMPGYLPPKPFVTMFRFVQEEAYAKMTFRDYLRAVTKGAPKN